MATTKSPGGPRRRDPRFPNDPAEGEGRWTGLKLQQRELNEHGMENPEGLYSPSTVGAPSTRKPNRKSNGTSSSSETMLVADSSGPELAETLTARKNNRPSMPHFTPQKSTNIGTPRRGTLNGPLSSIPRNQTSAGAQSQSPSKRKLDFSTKNGRDSPYSRSRSPGRSLVNGRPSSQNVGGDIYDLPQSPERDASPPGGMDDDDNFNLPDGYNNDEQDIDEAGDDGLDEQDEAEYQLVSEEAASHGVSERANDSKKRRSGRLSKDAIDDSQVDGDVEDVEPKQPPPKRGKPGRPAKGAKSAALAAKDKNQGIKNPKKGKGKIPTPSALPTREETQPYRGTQRHRHQTPMEEDGVHVSQRGRHVYAPLQYWKGERAEFDQGSAQGQRSLREIIRIDEVTPLKRTRSYAAPKKSKKRRRLNVFEDDIEDDGEEPWEIEGGQIHAPVQMWDQEAGATVQDEEEEQPIAFSSNQIQPRPTPDNPNFLFTKCLNTPFFGSGMIELPPGGSKGLKNSRRFHFMFFVFSGKVAVEVAGTRFVISRGGMWQVPRGNFYGIANEDDTHTAKIFFAQGCVPREEAREPPSLENLRN